MRRVSKFRRRFTKRFCLVAATVPFLFPVSSEPSVSASRFSLPRPLFAAAPNNNPAEIRLFEPVSLTLDGSPLVSVLERYAEIYQFAYFIDRRVDPSTSVAGSFVDVPFVDALRKMLDDAELSFCVVDGSVLCVVPKDAAGELLLLCALRREAAAELPKNVAQRLTAAIDFSVEDFAEPAATFERLASRSRLKFAGFDKTPFDRWRAVEFKNVAVSDLTTLLLFGFDVDYRYDADAKAIRPTALDRSRQIERVYPEADAAKLKKLEYPNCEFAAARLDGADAIQVSGSFADVAKVEYAVSLIKREDRVDEARRAADRRTARAEADAAANVANVDGKTNGKRTPGGKRKVVSGSIKNKTLKDVFAFLQTNVGLECSLDSSATAAGLNLSSRVSCEFRNADAPKIAATLAAELDAEFEIDGDRVVFSR
jgi:type II secretory pathway component GspD/PulD (secretin)